MPCVSTIPPKLSDRTIGSTTACLSLSFLPPPIFPLALTSLSHSLSLTLTLYLSVSLRVLLRSWEYTEAIRNSIRSPWRDTAVYWTGPRHGGASHFLPREILVEEKRRRLSWPRFASMDSQRNHQGRENWFFLFFFFYSPSLLSPPSPLPPVLFTTHDDSRPFDDSWITFAINHHIESSIRTGSRWFFALTDLSNIGYIFLDIPIPIKTRVKHWCVYCCMPYLSQLLYE